MILVEHSLHRWHYIAFDIASKNKIQQNPFKHISPNLSNKIVIIFFFFFFAKEKKNDNA